MILWDFNKQYKLFRADQLNLFSLRGPSGIMNPWSEFPRALELLQCDQWSVSCTNWTDWAILSRGRSPLTVCPCAIFMRSQAAMPSSYDRSVRPCLCVWVLVCLSQNQSCALWPHRWSHSSFWACLNGNFMYVKEVEGFAHILCHVTLTSPKWPMRRKLCCFVKLWQLYRNYLIQWTMDSYWEFQQHPN